MNPDKLADLIRKVVGESNQGSEDSAPKLLLALANALDQTEAAKYSRGLQEEAKRGFESK